MPRVLVTGGGGFIGGAVIRRLRAGGHGVRSYSRGSYPDLERLGVEAVRGDLSDSQAVAAAVQGCDAVVHVAAKAGIWGPYEDYYQANVVGTRHVLEACRRTGVRRLVFTGSPSAVFTGADAEGITESAPYPRRHDSHYSRTKAISEEMVLAADGPELATVSLRPHLVWGPGDPNIAPRLIARARAGVLRRIGGLNKKVDATFIDDAAEAHVLALERLSPGSPAAGKAYFISGGDPRPLWEIINGLLGAAGLPPVEKSVPYAAAWAGACAAEALYRLLGIQTEPRLTRFVVHQLTTAHWFDISAARRDLGYVPKVTFEEGLTRFRNSLQAGQKLSLGGESSAQA